MIIAWYAAVKTQGRTQGGQFIIDSVMIYL